MNAIEKLDYQFFQLINGSNDPILDFIMYWSSDKWIWIPFYLWLLYFLIRFMGKKVIYLAVMVAILIALSDQISVFFKYYFSRLRPCHDPLLTDVIHLVNNKCGGRFGFPSSHASNSMTIASLLILILPPADRLIKIELAAYVLLVGYSRIYLGAHFPMDVIAGWLLGGITALTGYLIWRKFSPVKTQLL